MDKIGLVTITYNSADVLRPFLDCVWKQTHSNLILYVIDNASADATLPMLENKKDSRLRIVKNTKNFGVAKANNQGIRQAILDGCDQVLIINNDVEFESTLIEKLIKIQIENKCSLVTPKMMYYDNPNHIWYAGSDFLKIKGFLPIHKGMRQRDEGEFNGVFQVEYAPTCCLLVKKQVFEDVGLMDEKYFVYFDDTDFLYRVLIDERHKLFYFSDVEFYHKVGSLTKSVDKEGMKEYRSDFFIKQTTRNHVYFLKKIGGSYAYLFILFLLFKNNIRIFTNPKFRLTFKNWKLINKSYFEGLRM